MPIEFQMLAFSVILGLVYVVANLLSAVLQKGLPWAMGTRENSQPLSGAAGRLQRALGNFIETFPLFAAAIFLVYSTGTHNANTALGAQIYFWARAAYLPIYALGIPVARTLIWTASIVGIVLVIIGVM